MPRTHAIVGTEHASRYLQQLCKHWAHRFSIELGVDQARIALPLGEARLSADDAALEIHLVADDGDKLSDLRDVVANHVERFAFRETLRFEWVDG